jgi:hypothetical protein
MNALRLFSVIIALLLAGSEAARWWGDARMVPLAFDEWLLAAALGWAAWAAPRRGAWPLALAWVLVSGWVLALFVPTLDHLLFGEPKTSATFYAVMLGAMQAVALGATVAALRLSRPG